METMRTTVETLRQWKIVKHLEEEFLQSVKLFCTSGYPGNKIALMVTTSDEVYAIVRNATYFSAFGISGSVTPESMILPHRMDALCGKSISGICIGSCKVDCTFCCAWSSDGSVYSWGCNNHGQLGNGEISSTFETPALVAGLAGKKIIAVRTGEDHTLALTDSGEVYAWGRNEYGCVGSGDIDGRSISSPVKIGASLNWKVVDIACGPYFSAALTNTGEIFSWGDNSKGQLGNGNTINSATPIKLRNFETFSKVVCGENYMLALTTSNAVYGWGTNSHYELGMSDKNDRSTPTVIPVRHVVDISANFTSGMSVCQTIDGKVHYWGHLHGLNGLCIRKPWETDLCKTMEDALAYFPVLQTLPQMIQFIKDSI